MEDLRRRQQQQRRQQQLRRQQQQQQLHRKNILVERSEGNGKQKKVSALK